MSKMHLFCFSSHIEHNKNANNTKFLIDFRRFNDKTGLSSYLAMILDAIAASDNTFYILLNKNQTFENNYKNIKIIYAKTKPFSLFANFEIPYLIFKNKIDIFHAIHFDIPLFIFLTKAKLISTIHDIIPLKYPEYYKSSFIKNIYFKLMFNACGFLSNKVLTVSNYTKKDLVEYLKIPEEKITVIYNSYNKASYQQKNKSENNHKYMLFFVGTNFRHKNIHVVIEAIKILKEKGIDVFFNIAGAKKDYTEFIQSLIDKLQLNDSVKIWGKVSEQELEELYGSSDCYVFPSLVEGFGIPLLEAMDWGLPVISSNKTVMPEIVGDAGILIEPTAENFAKSIELLINNPDLAKEYVNKGYERLKKFSLNQFKEKYLKLIFDKVCNYEN